MNHSDFPQRTSSSFTTKFKRIWLEHPLIPIGMITTIGFLLSGLYSMRKGNKARSQLMMRGRVFAQGCTLIAMLIAYKAMNKNKINQNSSSSSSSSSSINSSININNNNTEE